MHERHNGTHTAGNELASDNLAPIATDCHLPHDLGFPLLAAAGREMGMLTEVQRAADVRILTRCRRRRRAMTMWTRGRGAGTQCAQRDGTDHRSEPAQTHLRHFRTRRTWTSEPGARTGLNPTSSPATRPCGDHRVAVCRAWAQPPSRRAARRTCCGTCPRPRAPSQRTPGSPGTGSRGRSTGGPGRARRRSSDRRSTHRRCRPRARP